MRSLRPLCVSLLFVQSVACIQIGEDVTGQSALMDMDMSAVSDLGGDGADAPDSAPDLVVDPCAACGEMQACVDGACVECADHMDCKDPTRPVCDVNTNTCVECVESQDCSDGRADTMGRPVCDMAAQRCVACIKDSGCGVNEVCDVDDTNSAANVCVECLGDGDCTNGEVCDLASKTCVECVSGSGCAAGICKVNPDNASLSQCVECLDKNQCKDPSKSRCDMTVNTCVGCMSNDDCTQVPGELKVCDAGTCRRCTVDDESACGGKSCDPATYTCTGTTKESIASCGSCKADSECDGYPNYRCIALKFENDRLGGFCLRDSVASGAPCGAPYPTLLNVSSLSGHPSSYCAFNQNLATCTSIKSLEMSVKCAPGDTSACGANDPAARCENFGTSGVPDWSCTYACTTANQCPNSCRTSAPRVCD